ncbi:hypothetical protein [Terrabacter sp. RAF57]|uniref:hypothetical protein n=1 Tax=Terrabacter sp. RAF57 TaxID=3233063 RepID=UPI003F94F4C1
MVTRTEVVADVDEVFMALVCGDDELLRAEFEAIVGAGWPPVGSPCRPDRPGGAPRERRRLEDGRREETQRAVRGDGGPVDRGRERAPPP